MYSYSFAPKADWSDRFGSQPEIWQYLRDCAATLDLDRHITTGCNVESTTWDTAHRAWNVQTSLGAISARMIVVASGTLNEPRYPDIDGQEVFAGTRFHSSHWPQGFDANGLRIAVIGTGASAIQIVPSIAPDAKSIHVFQRTPAWVVPRGDRVIPEWSKRLYASLPRTERASRWTQFATRELMTGGFVKSGPILSLIQRVARRHLEAQVDDVLLRQQLTPDFRVGCKRILSSDDWYPALQRPNVALVTDEIAAVNSTGVSTEAADHEFDAIVYATGFQINRLPMPFVITGAAGTTLAYEWGVARPSAYLGTTVTDFPNMAIMTGPNTGLANSSMLLMMESQAKYLAQMTAYLQQHPDNVLDVRADIQQHYTDDIDRRLKRSVWVTGGCQSWYQDDQGRVVTLWPGTTSRFARLTRTLEIGDFV